MSLHQHLEEQLKEDLKLLKEYEEKLRCATDPREKRRYSNEIQKLKQQISEREAEVQSLQQKVKLSHQALIEHYLQIALSELEPADIRRIEQALQSNTLDANMLAQGCKLLRKEKGLDLVINQLDWIYELAVIADGGKPRYLLPKLRPTGRLTSTDWIVSLLKQGLPGQYASSIALTLGAFGVFIPEMVPSLKFLFANPKYDNASRDAALIYLSLIGSPEVVSMLVQAADIPEREENYYRSRGLFGLLLIDDVNVLAEQLHKASLCENLIAYAFGLAGSRDPQGQVLLAKMKNNHPSKQVRSAINVALNWSWTSQTLSVQSLLKSYLVRFTDKAKKSISLAQEESRRIKQPYVGTEEILLGLLAESTSIAAKKLKLSDVNLTNARLEVEKRRGSGSGVAAKIPFFGSEAKQVLELSIIEADELRHNYVGTEHLLLGLIEIGGESGGAIILKDLGVDLQRLRNLILQAIAS